jgi:NADH dehydrogenase/NADH:ubiquinone oxidoreductase subunit G
MRKAILVVEEKTISPSALESVVQFVAQGTDARLLVVPATANAIGLRQLGFTEELRTLARAWLAVGADPVATPAGRQHLPGVETLVALSAIQTATTARAHVVLPMRLPHETRGHVIGAAGEKELSIASRGPLEEETWEILLRLLRTLSDLSFPEGFGSLRKASMDAVQRGTRGGAAAGTTASGLSGAVDRRLGELGI